MEIADVRHDADNSFTVELQQQPENAVRRRVMRPKVQHHGVAAALSGDHCVLLQNLVGFRSGKSDLCLRKILTQRKSDPSLGHQETTQVRVTGKLDAE